jgi:hypothetical protein
MPRDLDVGKKREKVLGPCPTHSDVVRIGIIYNGILLKFSLLKEFGHNSRLPMAGELHGLGRIAEVCTV